MGAAIVGLEICSPRKLQPWRNVKVHYLDEQGHGLDYRRSRIHSKKNGAKTTTTTTTTAAATTATTKHPSDTMVDVGTIPHSRSLPPKA